MPPGAINRPGRHRSTRCSSATSKKRRPEAPISPKKRFDLLRGYSLPAAAKCAHAGKARAEQRDCNRLGNPLAAGDVHDEISGKTVGFNIDELERSGDGR